MEEEEEEEDVGMAGAGVVGSNAVTSSRSVEVSDRESLCLFGGHTLSDFLSARHLTSSLDVVTDSCWAWAASRAAGCTGTVPSLDERVALRRRVLRSCLSLDRERDVSRLSALLAECTSEWVNAGASARGDRGVALPDTVAEED